MKFKRQHYLYLALALFVVALLLVLAAPGVIFGAESAPPTPLPENRGWFNAAPVSVTAPFISPLATDAPSWRGAAAATAGEPEVYDLAGLQRTWDWLRQHYGNLTYVPATGARFRLMRIDSTVGPATIVVRVLNAQGATAYNQPVFLSWPGIDCSIPDPNIKPIDPGYKTRYQTCGIMQRSDPNGYTGYGMSGDWYYRNGNAPGIIWVGSPSLPSDVLTGIGMLGGTNHECPCALTFQEVSDSATPVPPTPVPGATPTPGPVTGDLAETNSLLRQILNALQRLSTHLGAGQ